MSSNSSILSTDYQNTTNLYDSQHADAHNKTSILVDPGPIYNSYTLGYFFIGFLITITSSILNAFGINLQKLDLNKQASSNHQSHPHQCLRPMWLLGLSLYILSQVLGSTLALQYMRSEYVAPLGSTSLIFNFLFARWLLGTKITTLDTAGTLVIIVGVVGVIGFGNIRQAGIDEEANMSLVTLEALWARPPWIIHLIILEVVTSLILWLANIGYEVIEERNTFETDRRSREDDEDVDVEMVLRRGGGRGSKKDLHQALKFLSPLLTFHQKLRAWLKSSIERWSVSRSDQALKKLDGLLWGCSAGLLAGQTLIFAKSFVKLVSNGLDHQGRGQVSDFGHPLFILILFLLVLTGVLQVWCLNRGLKVYDSTLIVPVLFATYTGSGFINSLIYLHELPHYRTVVLLMIWLCMGVLVAGVCMLSAKRVDAGLKAKPIGEYSSSADPEGEVQQTAIGKEEAVGMVMIKPSRPLKQRSSQSNRRQYSGDQQLDGSARWERSSSVSSAVEVKDYGETGSSQSRKHSVDSLHRTRHRDQSAGGLDGHRGLDRPTNRKSSLALDPPGSNPFADFEILKDEELPEDQEPSSFEQDEVDGLDDHHGYFHPPQDFDDDARHHRRRSRS